MSRRTCVALTACLLAGSAVGLIPLPSSADAAVTIRSSSLAVDVDGDFPRVIGYTWLSDGSKLPGQTSDLTKVQINGTEYTPAVTTTPGTDRVDYAMRVEELDMTINARLAVTADTLTFSVTDVTEKGATKLEKLAIPGHSIVSASSDLADATVSSALIYKSNYDTGPKRDTFAKVADAAVDSAPAPTNVAIVSAGKLAASVWSSSFVTYGPLLRQTTQTATGKSTGVWSNTWIYRGPDGKTTDRPEIKVVLTGERNGDGKVDWQDGAVAYRQITPSPKGSESVPDNVIGYISMNFASTVGNPFLAQLDKIKMASLYTDGLGQWIQLKGYASEGHDQGHPDYGGHYNTRAGGLKDLNTLVEVGKKYGARIGVHVNANDELMETKAFRWDKLDPNDLKNPCYVWVDRHFCMNQTKDLVSGDHFRRVQQLRQEVPNLAFIYNDVYFGEDWRAWRNFKDYADNGFESHTEFPSWGWPYVTWYHQSGDYDYIGINSDILRFIYNDKADTWVGKENPLLKGMVSKGIGQWHGDHDVKRWIDYVYDVNLPTKFLQHFQITNWAGKQIRFTGNVTAELVDNAPRYSKDGKVVLNGDSYLLPWPPANGTKAYHWNAKGGRTTWQLPASWRQNGKAVLYELTDTGRKRPTTLRVHNGSVDITAKAKTPYLLVPAELPAQVDVKYGEGGTLVNPSFTAGSTQGWTVRGDAAVGKDDRGWYQLNLTGTGGSAVQRSLSLQPGTYTAAAYVSTDQGRRASLKVSEYGGAPVETWIDTTPPKLADAVNRLQDKPFQKIKTVFTVPAQSSATVTLSATGSGNTSFTDVRIVRTDGADPHRGGHFFTEDFEAVDQGWGPFIQVEDGESGIHLAELNKGYTRDALSGKFSLKLIESSTGTKITTWPGTLRFEPGHAYRVRFDYASDGVDAYRFELTGGGKTLLSTTLAQTTDRPMDSAPPDGPKPEGWTDSLPPQGPAPVRKVDQVFTTGPLKDVALTVRQLVGAGNPSAVLDNLIIDDLGTVAGSEAGPVATLALDRDSVLPGQATPITVTISNKSGTAMTEVTPALQAPEGWQVQTPGPIAQIPAGGSATATFTVTPPQGTAVGAITISAAFTWNNAKVAVAENVGFAALFDTVPSAYNNVGTTDAATAGKGRFDASGNSYLDSALAAQNLTPGGEVKVDGMTFTWPSAASDGADNIQTAGQIVKLNGKGVLGVLGAATVNTQSTITVKYTDGTTSSALIGFPAWNSAETWRYGARTVATVDTINSPSGPVSGTYRVFYNSLPLEQGKTVASVTLPSASGIHVFDLATRALVTAPPTATVYASDLEWASATSGWGPVERDHALGENLANDGDAIRLNGKVYAKGLGAAPFSDSDSVITYNLGGKCTRFTAEVGLDDRQTSRGSVVFKVLADGREVYAGTAMGPTTPTVVIDADISGAKEVKLVTGNAGDGDGNDHGSWGDAKFTCG
ncbi:endo-alpha-N-acetylgalactosaminidase family protein [Nonomuraea sp. NPDC000554]|uniref:endo-alpha-N-acetylgalactosaminidase family protein n=1 Tax=Nonomuraea sp. NPDC000554 TaxID=3154259 RepID=UPI00332DB98E